MIHASLIGNLGTELRVTTLSNFSLIWKTSKNINIPYNFLSPESEVFARSFMRAHRQCEMPFQRILLANTCRGGRLEIGPILEETVNDFYGHYH
jgi:hypothetical protein